jgi:hypothetical protein
MIEGGFSDAALWNRSSVDLRSSEIIAQILDRGCLDDWRQLYKLCAQDRALRQRVADCVFSVPLAYGHFWLAALTSLGEDVRIDGRLPKYEDFGT